jgi:beta-glucanase (GH16 family)
MAALTAALAMTALSALGVAESGAAPARGAELRAVSPATVKPKPTTAKAILPPKYYRLTFSSNFSGYNLNTKIWGTCYPWGSQSGCTNFGNRSDPEKEWYQPSQIKVENGALALIANRVPTRGFNQWGQPTQYACRSGMITSFPSLNWKYGFLQITARIPFGKGLWSAFWLVPSNWTWPPEVDVLEHWGSQTVSKIFLHPIGMPEQESKLQLPNAHTGWHTFTLKWTSKQLIWYFDGHKVYTATSGVPQQSMYLIANLAVDDATPGGCNGTLFIKSIKLWRP